VSVQARLARLDRRFAPPGPPRCLTLFYVAVGPGEPTGIAEAWGGAAREVRYPAGSPVPRLPGGPHKLVRGPVFEV
jgi:hypothetical protein